MNDYLTVRSVYLAHFGVTGQKKGIRRHQSYTTAPTRSGMVGQEIGEAAAQATRLSKKEERLEKLRSKLQKESDKKYDREAKELDKWVQSKQKKLDKYIKNHPNGPKNPNKQAQERQAKIDSTHLTASLRINIMRAASSRGIANMSYKDLSREKLQRGVDVLAELGGVGVGIGMTLLGSPVSVYTFNAGRARRQNRIYKRGLEQLKRERASMDVNGTDLRKAYLY